MDFCNWKVATKHRPCTLPRKRRVLAAPIEYLALLPVVETGRAKRKTEIDRSRKTIPDSRRLIQVPSFRDSAVA